MSTRRAPLLVSGLSLALLSLHAAHAAPPKRPAKPEEGKAAPAAATEAQKPAPAAAGPDAGAPAKPALPDAPLPSTPPAPSDPGAGPNPKEDAARAHFFRGVELYQQGNYANAWLEFTSAYQLVPRTALLNNMARCEVKISRPAEALQHFRDYLASSPDDPDAEYIRQEIARLEGELGRRATVAKQAVKDQQVVDAPPPAPRRVPVYSIGLGITTVAALIAGAAALGLVNSQYDTLASNCVMACPRDDVAVLQRQAYAGYGLLGAAGVFAIATGVALRFELSPSREGLRRIAGLRLTGAGLAFGSH
jgi:tetratricopeptide (TPR) repeat protein